MLNSKILSIKYSERQAVWKALLPSFSIRIIVCLGKAFIWFSRKDVVIIRRMKTKQDTQKQQVQWIYILNAKNCSKWRKKCPRINPVVAIMNFRFSWLRMYLSYCRNCKIKITKHIETKLVKSPAQRKNCKQEKRITGK